MNVQHVFSPIKFGFEWTNDGWYSFDRKDATTKARKARDDKARELKTQGYAVKKFSLPNQLVSMGGIGSNHPHIEEIVNCYGLNASLA